MENIFVVNCSPRTLEVTLPVLTQLYEKNKGTGLLPKLFTYLFGLGTFRERGYAFSRIARHLSLGITVKLSCKTTRKYAPLESCWLGQSSKIWLYQIQMGFIWLFSFYFKDFPVGKDHEKGQHPSRTIVDILEKKFHISSLVMQELWLPRKFVSQTKAKGLCATL